MSGIAKSHNLPDRIETKRLLLRAPMLADAPALTNLANNKNIHKFLARLPHPYSREHALDFITNKARTLDEHAWAIINEASDFIGVIGLHLKPAEEPELGYWLGEIYWGRGYATEAAKAVIKTAHGHGFSKIISRAIAGNIGSIRVLQKCGFVKTAQRIDDCGQHKGVMVAYFERDRAK